MGQLPKRLNLLRRYHPSRKKTMNPKVLFLSVSLAIAVLCQGLFVQSVPLDEGDNEAALELDERDASAYNVNNIAIGINKVCREMARNRGKREEEEEEVEWMEKKAYASNVNNIDVHGVRRACRCLGFF